MNNKNSRYQEEFLELVLLLPIESEEKESEEKIIKAIEGMENEGTINSKIYCSDGKYRTPLELIDFLNSQGEARLNIPIYERLEKECTAAVAIYLEKRAGARAIAKAIAVLLGMVLLGMVLLVVVAARTLLVEALMLVVLVGIPLALLGGIPLVITVIVVKALLPVTQRLIRALLPVTERSVEEVIIVGTLLLGLVILIVIVVSKAITAKVIAVAVAVEEAQEVPEVVAIFFLGLVAVVGVVIVVVLLVGLGRLVKAITEALTPYVYEAFVYDPTDTIESTSSSHSLNPDDITSNQGARRITGLTNENVENTATELTASNTERSQRIEIIN